MFKKSRTNRTREIDKSDLGKDSAESPASKPGSEIRLRSLAPEYNKKQHATYVSHLEVAVTDPKNKNIALTGRYGSGKSSILDHFLGAQERKQKKALRISINTLGPDDDEDLTNRIQKELVKQLVYRASPGQIRHSRFARRKDPTWQRTLVEAAIIGVAVFGLLWLFGIRPDANALGTGHVALPAIAFLVLTVAAAWAARWVIGNRLVSQFSTGGTSISFDKEPESYFDEYLDEIMAFFVATKPDLVVFEDLDRFDDPRIFDSLRELNTLINASVHWKEQEQPLRFVYAIKDSLFEKLGEDPQGTERSLRESATESQDGTDQHPSIVEPGDKKQTSAVQAAVERANRTKFFEIVIPVVPFLSHSNARDLLSTALDELNLPAGTEISRELLDLVARHATDMRLLINVCNEFVVFAQRLLWVDTPTPGMSADDLFALVVYKNFQLADFENLPHRGSVLDALEEKRKKLVQDWIKRLHQEKRALLRGDRLQREQADLSQVLGDRLMLLPKAGGHTLKVLRVGERDYDPDAIYQSTFWKDVSETRKLSMELQHRSGQSDTSFFVEDELKSLFREGMDPQRWHELDPGVSAQRTRIDRQVASLRGADFADLAEDKRYVMNELTFDDQLEDILASELARDLVRRGFVNRYYAEYSTTFYGDFLGVDVANFFRNRVWPNEMDVQFKFTTPNAVRNLLEQAPAGLASSRSVLNIQIVDHMLKDRPELAKQVVAFLIAEQGEDALAFIDAFFNDASSCKAALVRHMTAHPWSGLLDYLALEDSVPDESTRTALLDTALLSAQDADSYDLGEKARELIVDRHRDLTAFTKEQSTVRTQTVLSFLHRAGLIAPTLRCLSTTLRRLVVEDGTYALTADNLRAGLGLEDDEAITLDRIRHDNAVWRRCKDDADAYFDAVKQDDRTEYAVLEDGTLCAVISEQYKTWSDDEMKRMLDSSAPDVALDEITDVPADAWPAIVRSHRVQPSARNVLECTVNVDADLAGFLERVDQLHDVDGLDPEARYKLALRMLNSTTLEASKAVELTKQLDLQHQLSVLDLEPGENDLLARLLDAKLLPDAEETFAHFIDGAGWPAVSEGFVVSERATIFLNPTLVSSVLASLLRDPQIPVSIKTIVVKNMGEYVADGDTDALREAGHYARKAKIKLPIDQIERIAASVPGPDVIVWQLDADKDLSADDLMRVLALIGREYQGFGQGLDHEFDIRTSPEIGRILDRLTKEKRVKAGKAIHGRRKVQIIA